MGKVGRRGPHKERKKRLAAQRAKVQEAEELEARRLREERQAKRAVQQKQDWACRMHTAQWVPLRSPLKLGPSYCWEAIKYLNYRHRIEGRQRLMTMMAQAMAFGGDIDPRDYLTYPV